MMEKIISIYSFVLSILTYYFLYLEYKKNKYLSIKENNKNRRKVLITIMLMSLIVIITLLLIYFIFGKENFNEYYKYVNNVLLIIWTTLIFVWVKKRFY